MQVNLSCEGEDRRRFRSTIARGKALYRLLHYHPGITYDIVIIAAYFS